jgi:hypothetical protein
VGIFRHDFPAITQHSGDVIVHCLRTRQ